MKRIKLPAAALALTLAIAAACSTDPEFAKQEYVKSGDRYVAEQKYNEAVVQYRNSIQKTQEATLKTNLFRMRDAIDQYYADKGKYPSSLDALVSDQYLRKIPDDPFTKSADTWQTVPAEPDPGNPSAEPGIYDVKSGAPGQSCGSEP